MDQDPVTTYAFESTRKGEKKMFGNTKDHAKQRDPKSSWGY